jgi:hypothetical protein
MLVAAASLDVSLREVARAVRHLAGWAEYHSGAQTAPSRTAARLTYYPTSGRAGSAADQDAKEEA